MMRSGFVLIGLVLAGFISPATAQEAVVRAEVSKNQKIGDVLRNPDGSWAPKIVEKEFCAPENGGCHTFVFDWNTKMLVAIDGKLLPFYATSGQGQKVIRVKLLDTQTGRVKEDVPAPVDERSVETPAQSKTP